MTQGKIPFRYISHETFCNNAVVLFRFKDILSTYFVVALSRGDARVNYVDIEFKTWAITSSVTTLSDYLEEPKYAAVVMWIFTVEHTDQDPSLIYNSIRKEVQSATYNRVVFEKFKHDPFFKEDFTKILRDSHENNRIATKELVQYNKLRSEHMNNKVYNPRHLYQNKMQFQFHSFLKRITKGH